MKSMRYIPRLVAQSGPIFPPNWESHDAVGLYLLFREVSKHVKVVQSGQGSDEVFGGYHWCIRAYWARTTLPRLCRLAFCSRAATRNFQSEGDDDIPRLSKPFDQAALANAIAHFVSERTVVQFSPRRSS